MIRVTIELDVLGRGVTKEHLGTIIIRNDGTGSPTVGNYKVTLSKRTNPKVAWKEGKVEDFPRKRLNAYDLLYRALDATIGKRNGS